MTESPPPSTDPPAVTPRDQVRELPFERRRRLREEAYAARHDPSRIASLMTAHISEELRQLYHTQRYLTVQQLARAAFCRNPSPADREDARTYLQDRAKWLRRGNKWMPPRSDLIQMAPNVDGFRTTYLARQAVGASGLPAEVHAEAVRRVLTDCRDWSPTKGSAARVIAKMKEELAPKKAEAVIEGDEMLREMITEWLQSDEIKALIASRDKRYVTGTEVIESWGLPATLQNLKVVARVMPKGWIKAKVNTPTRSKINVYLEPHIAALSAPKAPINLDKLPEYVAQQAYTVVERDALRVVCGIGSRQTANGHISALRNAMRALGWKRRRSFHGYGWIYQKEQLTLRQGDV